MLRDEPKIKKYQNDDEPKSQDQMSPRVKKDIKSIKRRTQNKKNIKVMNPRAKIKGQKIKSKEILKKKGNG